MGCRDLHAYEKKIKKAKAKKNRDLAGRLVFRKPSYRLDHLVKERWGNAGCFWGSLCASGPCHAGVSDASAALTADGLICAFCHDQVYAGLWCS